MYPERVDAGELHRLGRRLVALSRSATGDPGDLALTPGELAVLEDVLVHPAASVTEIRERTGFAQSHVSTSVARLRERGLVSTAVDTADGRRTRVEATATTTAAIGRRAGRPIRPALEAVTGDPDRVAELLHELAALLLRP